MKVAKLVEITFMTRVIVEHDTPEIDIIHKAINKVSERMDVDGIENVDSIKDDIECPYNPEIDK